MRRTYGKKVYYDELNKRIMLIGIVFVSFTIIGTCLNKLYPSYMDIIKNSISSIESYYSADNNIQVKNTILSNLKMDFKFMSLIGILNLLVIPFPISILIFMLKGLSIGYTINSCILFLKYKGIKFVFGVLIKNFAIIPGTIILLLISNNYLKEFIKGYKNNNKIDKIFLLKRYLLNTIIIITITLFVQVVLNFIFVNILRFLVR